MLSGWWAMEKKFHADCRSQYRVGWIRASVGKRGATHAKVVLIVRLSRSSNPINHTQVVARKHYPDRVNYLSSCRSPSI